MDFLQNFKTITLLNKKKNIFTIGYPTKTTQTVKTTVSFDFNENWVKIN